MGTPDPSGVLAQYLDDVWDPEDAEALLCKLAAATGAGKVGTPLCLRVVGNQPDSAEILPAGYEGDYSEEPGTASYLWVLWTGRRPSRKQMIALYDEYDVSGPHP